MTAHLDDRDVTRLAAVETSADHPHLESCEPCRSRVEEERRWLARMAPLAREAEPERDLWVGISDALARERAAGPVRSGVAAAPRRSRLWLQVAAAVLLLMAGFLVGRSTAVSAPSPPESLAAADASAAGATFGPADEVQRAGTAYVAALGELRRRSQPAEAAQPLDTGALEVGNEVAVATLYGAVVELSRLTSESQDVERLLESADALRQSVRGGPYRPVS